MKGKIIKVFISLVTIFTCFSAFYENAKVDAAGTQIKTTWSEDSVKLGVTGSTDTDIKVEPKDSGARSYNMGFKITIGQKYEVGEFSVSVPLDLLTYKDGTKCSLDIPKLPFPKAPETNEIGLNYEIVGNNLVLKNTRQLTTTGGDIIFSLPWYVETSKVADGTSASIKPSSPGSTVNECKISFDTYARVTGANKYALDNIYTYPTEYTKWYGLTAADMDFDNYYYKTYRVDAYVQGTQSGVITYNETPDLKAGDKIVAMSTSPTDNTNGVHKIINASTGSLTAPTVNSGTKYCYVLLAYKKSNYTLVNNKFTTGANDVAIKFVSDEDHETSNATAHTDPGSYQIYQAPSGAASGFDKSPDTTTAANAGKLASYKFSDVKLGEWSVGSAYTNASITRIDGESTHGFVIADDYMFGQLQTGDSDVNPVKQLTQNDYYFADVYVRAYDNSFDAAHPNGVLIKPDEGVSTASGEVYVKTTTNGAWTKVGNVSYADMYNARKLWSADDATVMDSALKPSQVCAVKVETKGFSFKSSNIKLSTTTYIKKNAPTINSLLSGAENGTIIFDDSSWVGMKNQAGKEVRFSTYNGSQLGEKHNDDGSVTPAISDADYQAKQQATYGGFLKTSGPGEGAANNGDKNQLLALDQASGVSGNTNSPYHFRMQGFVNANGIAGNTSSRKDQLSWENDTLNTQAVIKYRTGGAQYYAMDADNTASCMDKNGLRLEQKSAVIYDLLPMGVEFKSVDKAYGVSIDQTTADVTATVVDRNYMGSGRSLVKFELSNVKDVNGDSVANTYYPDKGVVTPSAVTHASPYTGYNGNYLQTGFSVDYTVTCNWKNIATAKLISANPGSLIAYQDPSNTQLVGGDGVSDVTQDNVSQNKVANTVNHFVATKDGEGNPTSYYMDKLSGGNTTNASTVYNFFSSFPDVPTVNIVGLEKVVTSDMINYDNETSVQVGNDYQYQITFGNGDNGNVDNVILYDVLEDAQGSNKGWKGTFKSINTSTLEALGIKPVVYYSTYNGFDVDDPNFAYSLTDANQAWTTTEPADKTTIKAVAIDCSKKTDGNPFTLAKGQNISAFIQMTAPASKVVGDSVNTADAKQNGKAYNRAAASIHHTVGVFADQTTIEIDITFATKVSLVDNYKNIQVVKKDDTANAGIVANAKYKITATGKEDINAVTDNNGILKMIEIDKKGTVDTSDDVEVKTDLKLAPGTYTLKETESPAGYELNNTEYTITVTEDVDADSKPLGTYTYKITKKVSGTDTELSKDGANYVVTDKMSRANLEIIKQQDTVDANGNANPTALANVGFTLYTNKACTTVYKDENGHEVAEKVTGTNGKIKYDNLPSGTYYLKETTVPDGIVNPSTDNYDNKVKTTIYKVVSNLGKVTVTKVDTKISDNSETETALTMTDLKDTNNKVVGQSVTLANTRIKRTISGNLWADLDHLGDQEDPAKDERLIDGVTVKLEYDNGVSPRGTRGTTATVIDMDGNEVKDQVTDENGHYEFNNLVQGKYKVVFEYDSTNYDVTTINTTSVDANGVPNGNMAEKEDDVAVINNIDITRANLANANAGIYPKVTLVKEVLLNGKNVGAGTEANPVKVRVGDQFTYIVTATNLATDERDVVKDYTVTDSVPRGLDIDSISPTENSSILGQNVTWSNVTLKKGDNSYTVDVTVNNFNEDVKKFTNIAYGSQITDPDPTPTKPQITEATNKNPVNTGDTTNTNGFYLMLVLSGLGMFVITAKRTVKKYK